MGIHTIMFSWKDKNIAYRFAAQSNCTVEPGPEVIKLFSCSTQLSMKFVQIINLILLTIANSFLLNIAEYEKFLC